MRLSMQMLSPASRCDGGGNRDEEIGAEFGAGLVQLSRLNLVVKRRLVVENRLGC
jgi:hypothetical protein